MSARTGVYVRSPGRKRASTQPATITQLKSLFSSSSSMVKLRTPTADREDNARKRKSMHNYPLAGSIMGIRLLAYLMNSAQGVRFFILL